MTRITTTAMAAAAMLWAMGTNALAQNAESYNMQAARDLYAQGNFRSAVEQLNIEIEKNPDNGKAYQLYGTINHESNFSGDAIQCYRIALSLLDPKKDKSEVIDVKNELAELYFSCGQAEEGLRLLEENVAADETQYSNLSLCHSLALESDVQDLERAMKIGKKALAKSKSDHEKSEAWRCMADIEWAAGNDEEAYRCIMKAYGYESARTKATVENACGICLHTGRYREATIIACNDLIDSGMNFSNFATLTSLPRESYDATFALVDSIISNYPDKAKARDAEYNVQIIKGVHISGDHLSWEAVEMYENPKTTNSIFGVTEAYIKIGAYGKAAEVIRKDEEKDGTPNGKYFERAMLCAATDDQEGALSNMLAAIRKNPANISRYTAMANLTMLYGKLSQTAAYADTAILLMDEYIDIEPYALKVRNALILGDKERAQSIAQRAAEIEDSIVAKGNERPATPDQRPVRRYRNGNSCIIRAALGDRAAVDTFTTEFGDKRSSKYNESWYQAAIAYTILGDKDKAFEALSNAIEAGYCGFAILAHTPELKWMSTERPDEYAKLMNRGKELLGQRP